MVQEILENKLKVAIYSGVFCASFIENLINAISKEGLEIYIFGKSPVSKNTIQMHYILIPRNRLLKLFSIKDGCHFIF